MTDTPRAPEARTVRDRQRERTRERLYDAALEVFMRDGVEAARIDDIATLAGVSRGTFYFHYPSKEDVLLRCLADSQSRISEDLLALPADTPIHTVLALTAGAIATEWQERPDLLREIGTVALKITAQNIEQATEQHPVQLALIPRFHHAVERGEISTLIPPELMTEFFLVNVFGAALAWCGKPMATLDQTLSAVVGFFLRAGAVPK